MSETLARGDTLIIPSPLDLHTHLREPGVGHEATIASETREAMYGGYYAVVDMPNTPGHPTWFADRAAEKHMLGLRSAHTDLGIWAGFNPEVTDRREIERRFRGMLPLVLGVKSYQGTTQGNVGTYDLSHKGLYRNLTTFARLSAQSGKRQPLALHAREEIGYDTAEFLLRKYDQPVYWCHVSTATEVDAAETLKSQYPARFFAEATVHHPTMTDIDARTHYGWLGGRMQPPLGKEHDFDKLKWAFNKGILSTIGTDHAPHPDANKFAAEEQNPHGHIEDGCASCFGVSGIGSVIPVMFAMIMRGETTVERVVDALNTQPHRVLGIQPRNARTILEIDPHRIGEEDITGNSRNTPYINWTGWARVLDVVVDGVSRFDNPRANTQILLPQAA